MYGLYDKQGILRFVDSDKEVCIAYAELFEFGSTNYCLMDLARNKDKSDYISFLQNQEESNN
tara:strand:- start:38 stop:223 length:186 start_codon:yes stop_codon:yes gene_type:complete